MLSTATHEALLDELEKISEELAPKKDSETKSRLKRWAKNTALIAGGYGAGQLTAMGVEKLVKAKLGPKWAGMSHEQRMRILGPAIGAATAGATLAAAHFAKTKEEANRE